MKVVDIKIDYNSVKINENYGSTQSIILGSVDIFFEAKIFPKDLKSNKRFVINECEIVKNELTNVKGSYIGHFEDLNTDFINNLIYKFGFVFSINNNFETFHHFPIPKYDYKYLSKEIFIYCKNCGSKISFEETELDDNTFCCPKCEVSLENDYEFKFEVLDESKIKKT